MSCSKQHYASAKQQPTSTSQMYQKDQQRKEQEEQQKFSSTSSNNREHQDGQNSLKNGGGGTPTDEEWEEDFEDFKEEVNLMELSDEETVDEADLTIEKTALKRLAIIDTLNLIHECAKFSPFVKLSKSFRPNLKCDALAILLLCRQLLLETFDLKLFIPDSYLNPNGGSNREKVTNIEILEELQKLGYLTTIRDHSHDDLLLLEYAKCTGGFIISNDKFRDHEQTFSLVSKDDQALRVIRERVVRFRIRLEDVDRLKDKRRSGKQLMGLAKGKHSDFLGIDIVLQPPSFKAMYAHPLKIDGVEDPTYGVVLNQRVQRSQRDAEKALERLTVLSHYYRLELCSFHSVHAEPLPWFDPAKRNLPRFYTFWRDYSRWQDDMAEQKQQDQQQGQGPQLESQKRGPYYR